MTVLTVLSLMVLLLALTIVFGVVAFRGDRQPAAGADAPVAASPPRRAPAPSPTGPPPGPPRPSAVPPVDPAVLGIPYTSGGFRANDGAYIDFDDDNLTGRRTDDTDIGVASFGVTGLDAVPLAVFTPDTDPTRLDCAAVPPQDWVVTVPTEQLTEGTRVCFITSEERYGYFVVMGRRLTGSGSLLGLELSYLVWEGEDRKD